MALGIKGYTLASPSTNPATDGSPNTFFYGFNGSFIGPPPPPPPPKIPPAVKLSDGDFAGSMGPTLPFSSGEGTFGNGGRGLKRGFGWSQSPMLAAPTVAGPNAARVLNVSFNQSNGSGTGSTSNSGAALAIGGGLHLAGGLLLAAKKSALLG